MGKYRSVTNYVRIKAPVVGLGGGKKGVSVTPGCLHHCEVLEGVPVFCVPACCSGHGLHFPSCCVFISVYLVQLSPLSCVCVY